MQQTFPLLCPEFYKHPKTTKLNLNTTQKKGNGNKLPSPSLLEHHHRRTWQRVTTLSSSSSILTQGRRWRQFIAIAFFVPTTPQKKRTAHCHCLFFAWTPLEKKVMATRCHHLFCYNNTTEKYDDTLPSSFSSQTQSRQNTHKKKKNKKKNPPLLKSSTRSS